MEYDAIHYDRFLSGEFNPYYFFNIDHGITGDIVMIQKSITSKVHLYHTILEQFITEDELNLLESYEKARRLNKK